MKNFDGGQSRRGSPKEKGDGSPTNSFTLQYAGNVSRTL
jgi:hypothetical protein